MAGKSSLNSSWKWWSICNPFLKSPPVESMAQYWTNEKIGRLLGVFTIRGMGSMGNEFANREWNHLDRSDRWTRRANSCDTNNKGLANQVVKAGSWFHSIFFFANNRRNMLLISTRLLKLQGNWDQACGMLCTNLEHPRTLLNHHLASLDVLINRDDPQGTRSPWWVETGFACGGLILAHNKTFMYTADAQFQRDSLVILVFQWPIKKDDVAHL